MLAAELSMNMLSFLLPFYDAGGLLVPSNRDSAADRGMLLLPCAHVTSQKPFFTFAIHMCACFLCVHRLIRRRVFVFRLSFLCCIACVCYWILFFLSVFGTVNSPGTVGAAARRVDTAPAGRRVSMRPRWGRCDDVAGATHTLAAAQRWRLRPMGSEQPLDFLWCGRSNQQYLTSEGNIVFLHTYFHAEK